MIKILFVGQIPPPHVGQFIIIEKLMSAEFNKIQMIPLVMSFSKSVGEIGRFKVSKVIHLFMVILRIWYAKLKFNPSVLYYPPAGNHMVPVYRDMIILISTRWLFEKVVFHFHAGGISDIYSELSGIRKWLFRKAFFECDVAIRLAEENPEDGKLLRAKKNVVIPYGIRDEFGKIGRIKGNGTKVPRILFVGMLRESKGLFVFLEACKLISDQKINFSATLVGAFISEKEEARAVRFVADQSLQNHVYFAGVLEGADKWRTYNRSDIFCMPSFYESETFGLVAVEAMQFGLPVVATKWRGLQSIVRDNETGFLVPVKNSKALGDKLSNLILDDITRTEMGEKGRARYLQSYTEEKFLCLFEKTMAQLEP